ncbi:MAG: D-alanyl-D-alanine carboxypeptidase family protein, partial [Candidatus Gottesmanbacteria bacterium]|nr:D-alanyl-D-alanine carboxypeptidase family protein [Candidatus Gottesmanbacteria bacterium]
VTVTITPKISISPSPTTDKCSASRNIYASLITSCLSTICNATTGVWTCPPVVIVTATPTPTPKSTNTPTPTPTRTPTPTPTPIPPPCGTGLTCIGRFSCLFDETSCRQPSTGATLCCKIPTPTLTPTPTPQDKCAASRNQYASLITSCLSTPTCNATTGVWTCPILTPTLTPTPTPIFSCGKLYESCCGGYPNGSCASADLYCTNMDGGTCLAKPAPTQLGLCGATAQCATGYSCYNSHCVSDSSILKCGQDADVLAHANVAGVNGQQLDPSYVPPDLVNLETAVPEATYRGDTVTIQQDAVADIQGFVDEMLQNGYVVEIDYGYRSYETQAGLHSAYPAGTAAAGDSEHQTGLAMDIGSYGKVDDQGNVTWSPACTSNMPACAPTQLAISIAAKYGIAHPLGWDAPHFFVAGAVYPGIASYIQTVAGPTNSYYDELNAQIVKIQQQCLKAL